MKKIIFFLILCSFQNAFAQLSEQQQNILTSITAFAKTSAVTGREEEARSFVNNLFEKGICKQDKLGNLVITIGSGAPKRLFTAPLDEPGYVISQIQEDGYLRITPVGFGQQGTMFHQFLEGNVIKINTDNNIQLGVSTVPSSHYDILRAIPEKSKNVFQWQEAFVDIGVSNSNQVAAKGIKLLDPVTLNKVPMVVAGQNIAASAVGVKSAVIALATVAKTLLHEKFNGTVVIAFTSLELINGKGLETVVNHYGPFDEVIRFNRFLNDTPTNDGGILVDKKIPNVDIAQTVVKPSIAFRNPSTYGPSWNSAKLYEIGIPTNYNATPVETVSLNSAIQLSNTWLKTIENKDWNLQQLKLSNTVSNDQVFKSFNKESDLLSGLVNKYGVNPDEKPVRDLILSQLPKWAKPTVDEKGNIVLTKSKFLSSANSALLTISLLAGL